MIPLVPIVILLCFLGIILSVLNWRNRKLYKKITLWAICSTIIFYILAVVITDSNLYSRIRLNARCNDIKLTYKWKFKTKTVFSWYGLLACAPLGRPYPDKILFSKENATILFQTDNYAYAINKNNGKKRWIRKIGKNSWAGVHPALFEDKVIFATAEPSNENDYKLKNVLIQCLSIKDGKTIWTKIIEVRFEGYEGDAIYIVTVNDKILVSFYNSEGSNIYMLNGYTGEIIWERRIDGRIVAMPAFDVKRLFVAIGEAASQKFQPKIVAIDIVKGDMVWERKTNNDPTGISISNNYGVYLTENEHKRAENYIECIDLENGNMIWSKKISDSGDRYLPSPVIKSDVVYASIDNGEIVAYDLLNGKNIWESVPTKWGSKSNLIVNENVIFSGVGPRLRIFDKNNGKMLAAINLEKIRSVGLFLDTYEIEDLILSDNTVYFACSDGGIYALDYTKG